MSTCQGRRGGDAPKQFETYMVQDSIYLKEYARGLFALAMYRAETLREMQLFYDVLSVVINDRVVHPGQIPAALRHRPDRVDEDSALPREQSLHRLYAGMASRGLAEALMAVLPCMLSYLYIAKEVVKRSPDVLTQSPYGDWLADYASERYAEKCSRWAA